jgi:tight adherence protein C
LAKRQKVLELTGESKFDIKRKIQEITAAVYSSLKKINTPFAGMPRYRGIAKILAQLNLTDKYDTQAFMLLEEGYAIVGFIAGLLVLGSPLLSCVTALGAFLLPGMIMKSRLDKNKYQMLKSVPNSLDIISAYIESGLSLPASVIKYSQKNTNVFARELAFSIKKMELGRGFSEVMEDMGLRLDSKDVSMVVNAFLQAERSGGSVRDIIRSQAEEIRKRHFMVLKQKAHEAPVKMLIPMILFIFPVVFIILFGPIALKLMGGF